ncbi:GguC protein [Amylibacter kogurei]|uniref:GguC protein n=1 Tax=Paramylibacter kogurei TaxID=1889778 RepID=A0A2G5K7W1_9RHOB|nr:AraD1 family protein [Amylibacter kogurei]PIB25621.1 GguC protein [Amylibacter kogurei]
MFLSQIKSLDGDVQVIMRDGEDARVVNMVNNTYELATRAIKADKSLIDMIEELGLGSSVDLLQAINQNRIVLPVHHHDPAHLHMTGTGLTHLGSAATRNAMHTQTDNANTPITDSMRIFQDGVENGKPEAGKIGAQPEWFYKGNGNAAVAPESPLTKPSFALDAGEEPEIAGIYIISDTGTPYRIGYSLANEFSDHITERGNYLWLAHSKLRQASFGPEILIGDLPHDIRGTSRILRGDETLWEKSFLSGIDNMSHSIENLEHHHFKYDLFRQPGDLHVHFFGTATLSFADEIQTREGDIFEIDAPQLGIALRNPLTVSTSEPDVCPVTAL